MAPGSLNSVLNAFSLYKFSTAQVTKILNTDVNNQTESTLILMLNPPLKSLISASLRNVNSALMSTMSK